MIRMLMTLEDVIVNEADRGPWRSREKGNLRSWEPRPERKVRISHTNTPDFVCAKCKQTIQRKEIPFHTCVEGHLPSELNETTCWKCGRVFEKGELALRMHLTWCFANKNKKAEWIAKSSRKHRGRFTMSEKRLAAYKIVSQKLTGIARSRETRDKHS